MIFMVALLALWFLVSVTWLFELFSLEKNVQSILDRIVAAFFKEIDQYSSGGSWC